MLLTAYQLMALCSPPSYISCSHLDPATMLPPQGMLHCFAAVCWPMQQQQHHAPANNPTCSTTLAPAGCCCWQGGILTAKSIAAANKTCTGSQVAQGGPGCQGLLRPLVRALVRGLVVDGLCSSSIMLQQTIQLVPQHLLQLAAAGREGVLTAKQQHH